MCKGYLIPKSLSLRTKIRWKRKLIMEINDNEF